MTRCYVLDGLHILCRYFGLPLSFLLYSPHWSPCMILSGRCFPVRYDLGVFLRTIWSHVSLMYDINLGATATTILSIRGVQIPIHLVTSATDSFRRSVVLFKSLSIPTSDLKSEFLCQSSHFAQNLQTPLNHLVRLGYLPRPRHHVSPLLSQSKCSYWVP